MTKKKEGAHLPIYGVGPLYVISIVLLTAAGITLSLASHALDSGVIFVLRLPLFILGILLILPGARLWAAAVLCDKVDEEIAQNRLVTTGMYALVRNPIYTAFTAVCTGVLLLCGNLWLLILPPVFWLFLTLLMKATEEKWLARQYGEEYRAYCRRVNRCLPWFPKKTS